MAERLAVRIRGLGRYFGPTFTVDEERPREAMRVLAQIAGFRVKAAEDDVQRTVGAAGHVLRDVSLDIEQGSVVCLTGASGSGKTVLLQIIAGMTPPTAGTVELFAPVSTLLSIGDNLDAQMSGYDNILASSQIAGAPPDVAAAYVREVLEFSGLEGFQDASLRTYSTGMRMRLSVALALCGRPPIVLIDDVLNVGDIGFQQRCVDRVRALKEAGSTLILAFSDDALVQQLATRVIVLGNGRVLDDTPPTQWIGRHGSSAADVTWHVKQHLPEDDVVAVRSIALEATREDEGTLVELALTCAVKAGHVRCRPSVFVQRDRTTLFRSLYPEWVEVDAARELTFTVAVPTHMLPDGDYALTVSMSTFVGQTQYSLKAPDVVTLTVARAGAPAAADAGAAIDGEPAALLAVRFPWEIETVRTGDT